MVAILPFMLYQLAGFRTLDFLVPKTVNWIINIGIVCLIVASYILYREGDYPMERRLAATSGDRDGDYRLLRRAQAKADAGDLRRTLPAEGS